MQCPSCVFPGPQVKGYDSTHPQDSGVGCIPIVCTYIRFRYSCYALVPEPHVCTIGIHPPPLVLSDVYYKHSAHLLPQTPADVEAGFLDTPSHLLGIGHEDAMIGSHMSDCQRRLVNEFLQLATSQGVIVSRNEEPVNIANNERLLDCINATGRKMRVLYVAFSLLLRIDSSVADGAGSDCPLLPACCAEDCCGEGTSWDVETEYCISDPDSSGFNGAYSNDFEPGCLLRACCEADCCSSDLEYDEETASCSPRGRGTGNLGLGDKCELDLECASGNCYRDPEIPPESGAGGICVCDPDSNSGCEGEFFCASSSELEKAKFLVDSLPTCSLPVGASCDTSGSCLSGNCDEPTSTCTCNTFSQYGCASEEICVAENGQAPTCKVPSNEPIGSLCLDDNDCVSGMCYYGFIPFGFPGTCTCNTETHAGCDDPFVCASSSDLLEAQFLADASPGCYLPFNASCNPNEFTCVTGNCDPTTNSCTCNSLSNYPCDVGAGEECLLDGESGSYVCGTPPADCPTFTDGFCIELYAPVICDGCEYSNQCFATGANAEFTEERCSRVAVGAPGPI